MFQEARSSGLTGLRLLPPAHPGPKALGYTLRDKAGKPASMTTRPPNRVSVCHSRTSTHDPRKPSYQSTPFVLGVPVTRGSRATADRNATARALKIASAMW